MQNNSAVIVSVQYDGSHAPARFRRTPYSMALPMLLFWKHGERRARYTLGTEVPEALT